MKNFLLCVLLLSVSKISFAQKKFNDTTLLQPVEVSAVRAADKTPIAKTNLNRAEIAKQNIGQDLPFVLNQTPSMIVSSDAGNGVGYTYLKLRGSDASRINVTLNGIPYNDAESQGTFFVDMPDISSSAGSIQVQRGVGTSTNGAGAFAGSINISTNDIITKRNIEFNNTYGSYNTHKNTLLVNSGIFSKHFLIDARASYIGSNGYIDRASSKLKSIYLSSAYVSDKQSLRFNLITGKEKTYQAWNGIDEATLKTNRTYNSAGTERPGDPYDNETDNYTQTHYQLFYNRKITEHWKANIATFLTTGKGYYEQYKADRKLSSIGLPNYISGAETIKRTDWVRQLWLDNKFYGTVFSAQYNTTTRQVIVGGGLNKYDGNHFGKIIWAKVQAAVPKDYEWYRHNAFKTDASVYTKWVEKLDKNWQTFVDVQVRNVHYTINGFRDNPDLNIKNNFTFFNPKAGVTYSKGNTNAYFSYSVANKEPNREDFESNPNQAPKPERLHDFELGIERKKGNTFLAANLFYMLYKNQLVLTGKINDVGAYTRTNIDNSYRTGVELQAAHKFNKWISASENITFSSNKIKNFTQYLDNWDNGGQVTKKYSKTDISYSPNLIGALTLDITPYKESYISLMSKYVGKQYLDNTSNEGRTLNPYLLQDIRIGYNIKNVKPFVQFNNVFNKKYEPNGYTYAYIYNGNVTADNYYFPMAPFNWLVGVNIKF